MDEHWTDTLRPWRKPESWQWGFSRGLVAGVYLTLACIVASAIVLSH